MRFAMNLFAVLVSAGVSANVAWAQAGITTPAPHSYAAYGPGQSALRDSNYTGPYSVYGPGLTYRPLDYTGPYSGRLSSASSIAPTRLATDAFLRTADPAPVNSVEPGVRRYRYVRLSIAGGTVQAIVSP